MEKTYNKYTELHGEYLEDILNAKTEPEEIDEHITAKTVGSGVGTLAGGVAGIAATLASDNAAGIALIPILGYYGNKAGAKVGEKVSQFVEYLKPKKTLDAQTK